MVGLSGAATALAAPPTFAPAITYATGSGPIKSTVADFDEDGNLDLAIALNGADAVDVLFGNGDGTFDPAVTFPVGDSPFDVIHADINLDSNEDLLVTKPRAPVDSTVTVLLGDGVGGFTASAVSLGPNASIIRIAVGLLDGDANLDIAATTSEPAFSATNTVILLGNGDGTFGAPTLANQGGVNPNGVAIALLDGDSFNDLIVVNNASHNFAVMLGNGDGHPRSAGDLLDWAVLPGMQSGHCGAQGFRRRRRARLRHRERRGRRWLLARGRRRHVRGARALRNGRLGGNDTTVADFDADGELDLAVSNINTGDASVLTGNGDGSFDTGVVFPSGNGPLGIEANDFNEDGRPDLAVSNFFDGTVSILLNTTDSTPPNTIIDTFPPNPTNSTAANFTFHGVDPAPASLPLTFECQRDGGG